MNKKCGFFMIGLGLVFVIYVTLLSLVTPIFGVTYIVTLLFSLFAVSLLAAVLVLFLQKETKEGYFYQAPALRMGVLHIAVQFILGFILTILVVNIRPTLIIEILILAVFGGMTAYTVFGGIHAKEVNDKNKVAISNMKKLADEAKAIMDGATDYEWKRLVKGVWEDIHYAPPVTTEETERIENDICLELGMLRKAVGEKNREEFDQSATKIKELLADRKA